MNKEQIIAHIRNLGFQHKDTIQSLTQCIEHDENIMPALKSLVNNNKQYELTLTQISRIAISENGALNLLSYIKHYPKLKKLGFDIDHLLLDIIKIHAPHQIFPVLVIAIPELKQKNWSDKLIQKLFCFSPEIEKIERIKDYFLQFKAWHLSKSQIKYLIENYNHLQIESMVSSIHHLHSKGYSIESLIVMTCKFGLRHLNSLYNLSHPKILEYFTRHEIMSMLHRAEGAEVLNALEYNYTDLAAMGYKPIKIKSILLQEIHQPQSFIQKNMCEFDDYLSEMHQDREKWFKNSTYSMFASNEEIDERCDMYLEDTKSNKQNLCK